MVGTWKSIALRRTINHVEYRNFGENRYKWTRCYVTTTFGSEMSQMWSEFDIFQGAILPRSTSSRRCFLAGIQKSKQPFKIIINRCQMVTLFSYIYVHIGVVFNISKKSASKLYNVVY